MSLPETPPLYSERTIYALVDPRDDLARYVGETSDPYRRWMQHIAAGLLLPGTNKAKEAWMRELVLMVGKFPILEILEFPLPGQHFACERYWIGRLRDEGHPLLNGERTAWTRTPEGKEIIRAVHHRHRHTPETRERMRIARQAYLKKKEEEGR